MFMELDCLTRWGNRSGSFKESFDICRLRVDRGCGILSTVHPQGGIPNGGFPNTIVLPTFSSSILPGLEASLIRSKGAHTSLCTPVSFAVLVAAWPVLVT